MFACRSKPSRCAWHGPREVTQGASGSRPSWSTRAPARGPSAIRPRIEALLMPASAGDSSASGSTSGGVIDVESAARKETLDAPVDGGEQPRHLLVARGLGGVELEAPVSSLGEDAVQQEGVEVDVQLEAAPEALDHRHGAAPPVAHARARRAAAIEPEHGAYGDAEHRAAERVIVGEEIAQAVRQREHPLAHGDVRQDVIDEVCGLLRHAAAAAARTKAASFARERHEALEGTALAPNAREASAERAARQELAELSLDEAGEPAAIAAVGDLAQEGFQVLADDAMEDGALRGSGPIGGDAHGRWASEARAVPGSVPKTALRSWTARHRATGIRSTALRAESDRQHRRRKRRTVARGLLIPDRSRRRYRAWDGPSTRPWRASTRAATSPRSCRAGAPPAGHL